MTKSRYKKLILDQLLALGIYEKSYDGAIESLAAILEQRDKTFKEFKASAGKALSNTQTKAALRT